jgi:LysM repeat protein
MLRRKCSCGGACRSCRDDAPPQVRQVLATPGRPLDVRTRAHFEPRFAHDFTRVATMHVPQKLAIGEPGDAFEREADRFADRQPIGKGKADLRAVRVHADAEAAESARAVSARAYTVGSHIVFGAGEYAPHTDAGQRLLAHELAHVGQQSEGRVGRSVQRSLTVIDPGKEAQNQPDGRAANASKLTNAELVQTWVDALCGASGWSVDPATGVLSNANRNAFCGAPPAAAAAGAPPPPPPAYASSKFPASCKCLCDITAPGSRTVLLHTGDVFEAPDDTGTKTEQHDVTREGQGGTLEPGGTRTAFHVGISGRAGWNVRGAGASNPAGGSGRGQMLQDPPWIIFAHEVCGHVVAPAASSAFGASSHVQTPGGALSAVDVENQVRREHSTPGADLGIRQGERMVDDPSNPQARIPVRGSYVTAAAGDTLRSLATRFGIPSWRITWDIFEGEGNLFSGPDAPIAAGQILFVRGVFYHDVIAGETVEKIAEKWVVPVASLRRANSSLPAAGAAPAGTRLIIPAS